MVTHYHPEYAQRTRPGGGPARSHMFAGEDHGTVCRNTPYRQAYFDLVEHVVRDYDIDGIYFGTWRAGYFWPGHSVCYCDGCRDGFRKATGLELPWHEHDADYYLAPVERVRVRISIPKGKRVRGVSLLVEAPYRKTQGTSNLEVFLPRVEAYQGICVDLESP